MDIRRVALQWLMNLAGRGASALALALALTCVGAVQAELVEQRIDHDHGGQTFRGVLVFDDARVSPQTPGPGVPGVMVVPEWWGVNDYAIDRARQLAELGYVAFVADLYGLDEAGQPRVTEDGGQAQAWAMELYGNVPLWRARASAALSVLAAQPTVDADRLGAIGFCFGGATVQHMAYAGLDLSAVVSFHGTPMVADEAELANTDAAVMILHGADDPFDPLDKLRVAVDALEASDVDYQVNLYGHAVHSFSNPAADGSFHPGAQHSPTAEPRAWSAMRRWLREHLVDAMN